MDWKEYSRKMPPTSNEQPNYFIRHISEQSKNLSAAPLHIRYADNYCVRYDRQNGASVRNGMRGDNA